MKPMLSIALLILLMGCSNNEKNVSVFVYNNKDPFIRNLADNISSISKDVFSIRTVDSENFQITQNENIEESILSNDDLLIINPVDRLGVYPIIKKLKSEDIPVIFFNREPLKKDLNLWEKAYYVGTKGEQAAIIQAEIISELFGNTPSSLNMHDKNGNGIIELVILKGEQGHQDAEIRTIEVINSLKSRGYDLDILKIEVANWSRMESYDKMKDILKVYGNKIELVISNNDSMAIGAITAMRQAGIFRDDNENGQIDKDDYNWIPVVGIDGLTEAKELIKSGYLYGTVLNDTKLQAQAIKELSECILNNISFDSMNFELLDNKYILIDHKILQ